MGSVRGLRAKIWKMKLWFSLLLVVVLAEQLQAGRFGRSSSSRSSSSRSSSSRSSSSWARPSSSSSSRRSSSLGSRIKNVFRRSSSSSSSSSSRPSSSSWARSSSTSSSSYPRQSWTSSGSSSGSRSSFGSSSGGIGGQAAPRPSQTNFGSSYPSSANRGSSFGSSLGKPGAAYPGSTGSSLGGGGFVQPRPAGGSSSLGGGGFVQPKPGHSGSSMVGAGLAGAGVGGLAGAGSGGLASSFGSGSRPGGSSSSFGSSSGFGSSSSSSSGIKNMAGAGLAGGLLGGAAGGAGGGLASRIKHAFKPNRYGTNQYQSFSKPKKSFGSYLFGSSKKPYGYKTPGHGTSWGTNFAGGVGKWKPKKSGVSKKMLGLGVGAGFLGGAALGVAGTMASYSVYHKYQEFKRRMHMMNPMNQIGRGWDQNYYDNNYQQNECMFGCPMNSHCEWGFCECNAGTSRRFGQCQSDWNQVPNYTPRPPTFDPFKTCISSSSCAAMDMNLICNLDVSLPGQPGTCECRRDMRWNTQEGECQFYMDVDCSSITYDTPASAGVLGAVSRAQAAQQGGGDFVDASSLGRTETMQESLQNSLLRHVDPKTSSEAELKEAFCRDIDAYSYDIEPTLPPTMARPQQTLSLAPPRQTVVVAGPDRRGANKPSKCENVPATACAVAYDSHNCDGGWRLVIPVGEMRFRWFTSTYSYRNDIDVVGVRAGCTFTGYSDSSFNGQRMTIRAEGYDRWEVLGDSPEFMHMDEDIESLQCVCRM